MNTDAAYARCAGRHVYTDEVVWRHHKGHTYQLRICQKCRVPESPKHISKLSKRPRSELGSYWD